MTTTQIERLSEREAEEIRLRRLEELVRAGYAWGDAEELAARAEVDLQLAIVLLQTGCPSEAARRILL